MRVRTRGTAMDCPLRELQSIGGDALSGWEGGVPVGDDGEGSAVEGGGVAEDEESLAVEGDVEDTKARGKRMDLEEWPGLAERKFCAFFLDGDGGNGAVCG